MGSFLTNTQSVTNKPWIGYAPEFESICNACNGIIRRLEIIIISPREFFHLSCFSYKSNNVLQISDFDIYLNNWDLQLLENYLFPRNLGNLPIKRPHDIDYDIKKKFTSGVFRLKRAWIEIFKFLHPTDEVLKLAIISKAIYDSANSEELWYHFYLVEYGNTKLTKSSWIKKYQETWKRTCFGCKTLKTIKSELIWCKYIKKPLCLNCIKFNSDFKRILVSEIEEKYFVNPRIIDFNFWVSDDGLRFTYHYELAKGITKWRQNNKENLLQKFKDINYFADLKELVDSLNLTNMTNIVRYPSRLKSNRFIPIIPNIYFYIRNQDETLTSIENYMKLI
ncbi:unnamed protein product [Blepharisma stoltei]|uniref:GATA-type domain-containing protein n=1 Tax=Blepharisma stoltei TaxID=1481888 RepID=A0AAU9J6R6_9CILI|nr:unnamed protein product [Blepharisma stoltei]